MDQHGKNRQQAHKQQQNDDNRQENPFLHLQTHPALQKRLNLDQFRRDFRVIHRHGLDFTDGV
ncbi:MAG: DUF1841 family protein [Acidobacteria bacterium]|nr:DUF1841 family protein [Acidobacteriota bacterium]